MKTFSVLLALRVGNSPITGEFSSQRSVTRSFDVFFDLCLNKRLSKQSSVRRHCNGLETCPFRPDSAVLLCGGEYCFVDNPLRIDAITISKQFPYSMVHCANMGPIWGRQDPGGPHGGPMNFAIWKITIKLWTNQWDTLNMSQVDVTYTTVIPCFHKILRLDSQLT